MNQASRPCVVQRETMASIYDEKEADVWIRIEQKLHRKSSGVVPSPGYELLLSNVP